MSLVAALMAACSGPFFEEPSAYETLLQAEEVADLAADGSRTFDLLDGRYLTVLSSDLFGEESDDAPQIPDRSSSNGAILDKGITVGSSAIDDGDTSFSIGRTAYFGQTEEFKGVYQISLPDIDYRALTSATLSIRGFASGNLNSLNFYETPAAYSSITGVTSQTQTYIGSAAISATKLFSLDFTSSAYSHLSVEGSEKIVLIAAGSTNNAVRSVYTVESTPHPNAAFVYDAPSVTGPGAAPNYEYVSNSGINCWAYALSCFSGNTWITFGSSIIQPGDPINQTVLENSIIPTIKTTTGGRGFHIRRISARTSAIYSYERRIAFRIGYWDDVFSDFHFMKQISNGNWAHKYGPENSEEFTGGHNPDMEIWGDICDGPVVYFAVST